MPNNMTFFPVGNGDMTLITTDKDINILMDCNMRKSAEEETNNDYDCNEYLHNHLKRDEDVVYVDALFLTHSDQDHCRGMREYFNLCSPEKTDDTKIRINELFVPARLLIDTEHKNDDADAIRQEANRRLKLFGTDDFNKSGNKLKIVGYSEELKEYNDLIIGAGKYITSINNIEDYGAEIFVLRPVKKDTDDENANVNDCTASFKISFTINGNTYVAIVGGDITCENWKEVIQYNEDLEFVLGIPLVQKRGMEQRLIKILKIFWKNQRTKHILLHLVNRLREILIILLVIGQKMFILSIWMMMRDLFVLLNIRIARIPNRSCLKSQGREFLLNQ